MIRSLTPGDLLRLRRTPRSQVVFYNENVLVQAHQPFWFALRCVASGNGHDRFTTAFHDKAARAFVQVRGRRGRPEQQILALLAYGTDTQAQHSDHDMWYRLLEEAVLNAGAHQVQRLYAAVWSQQTEMRELFRQLAFQSYTRREVLQLSGPDWNQGTRIATMRVQQPHDAWAIHKLYGLVTPHTVQHAEVRTPRSWMQPLTRRWHAPGTCHSRSWVLGPDDDLIAFLQAYTGTAAHLLVPLIHPAARDHFADVLRFGLSQLHDSKPVYLLLAEYQSELLTPAQQMGFQPIGEQTLLMKSTTIAARRLVLRPAFETEPSLEPRITVPSITVPREDTDAYVRTTRNDPGH